MNEEFKKFLTNWQIYRSLQAKLTEVRDKQGKSPKNVPKATMLMLEINEHIKVMDQQALVLQGAINAMSKEHIRAKSGMPLYEAFNAFFAETFKEHPSVETALISNISAFREDLNARFNTDFNLKDVAIKLAEHGEEVEGQGYKFKRDDFFVSDGEREVTV